MTLTDVSSRDPSTSMPLEFRRSINGFAFNEDYLVKLAESYKPGVCSDYCPVSDDLGSQIITQSDEITHWRFDHLRDATVYMVGSTLIHSINFEFVLSVQPVRIALAFADGHTVSILDAQGGLHLLSIIPIFASSRWNFVVMFRYSGMTTQVFAFTVQTTQFFRGIGFNRPVTAEACVFCTLRVHSKLSP